MTYIFPQQDKKGRLCKLIAKANMYQIQYAPETHCRPVEQLYTGRRYREFPYAVHATRRKADCFIIESAEFPREKRCDLQEAICIHLPLTLPQ